MASSNPNIVVSRPQMKRGGGRGGRKILWNDGRGRGRGKIRWNNNNSGHNVGQVDEACNETSLKLKTLKIDPPDHEPVEINLEPFQMTHEV